MDPGGNWIHIGQPLAAARLAEAAGPRADPTRLGRALNAAILLAESKGDYPAAAKMLDPVLAERQAAPPAERLPALVFRAGLALTMDEAPLARNLLVEARQLALDASERAALADELERAADREHRLAEA